MYSPDKPTSRIVEGNTPTEQTAKRAIIQACDAMRQPTDQGILDALWQRVYHNEHILRRELECTVREYEAAMRDKNAS